MLHREPEHDEGQRRLGHTVVLVEVMLHGLGQQVSIGDLVIDLGVHLGLYICDHYHYDE